MGEVVYLGKHLSGKARCLSCTHEWVAVAPEGTFQLECPSCGGDKGLFKNAVARGEDMFVCNCGCEFYRLNREGPYCINCGVVARGWF